MRVTGVREFRANATKLLHSKEPILVMRRGEVTGLFFPYPSASLPVEFKRELFPVLTDEIKRKLHNAGIKEEDLLEDAEKPSKPRRRR